MLVFIINIFILIFIFFTSIYFNPFLYNFFDNIFQEINVFNNSKLRLYDVLFFKENKGSFDGSSVNSEGSSSEAVEKKTIKGEESFWDSHGNKIIIGIIVIFVGFVGWNYMSEFHVESVQQATKEIVKVVSEVVPKVVREEATEVVSVVTVESTTETVSKVVSETALEATTQVATETAKEAVSEAVIQLAKETTLEATTQVVKETALEATTQVATETAKEAVSEAVIQWAKETASRLLSETALEATTQVATETASKAVSETTSEAVQLGTDLATGVSTEAIFTAAAAAAAAKAVVGAVFEAIAQIPVEENSQEVLQNTREADSILGVVENENLPESLTAEQQERLEQLVKEINDRIRGTKPTIRFILQAFEDAIAGDPEGHAALQRLTNFLGVQSNAIDFIRRSISELLASVDNRDLSLKYKEDISRWSFEHARISMLMDILRQGELHPSFRNDLELTGALVQSVNDIYEELDNVDIYFFYDVTLVLRNFLRLYIFDDIVSATYFVQFKYVELLNELNRILLEEGTEPRDRRIYVQSISNNNNSNDTIKEYINSNEEFNNFFRGIFERLSRRG